MKNLVAALLLSPVFAQTPVPQAKALPKTGDPAPALQFDHVIGGDAKAFTADALRDKVVVLEFATSWCGGCRAAVPHWNAVAAAMAGQPVVFLSVTNEAKATAEKFHLDVKLQTPLAVDLDGSIFEAFAVGGVPDTVVIGRDGRIHAFTGPQAITEAALEQLLAGEKVAFTAGPPRAHRNWNHQQPLGEKELEPGTFSFAPCAKPGGMSQQDPKTGTIRASGLPCAVLLSIALDCARDDVTIDPALDSEAFYDLAVRGADSTLAAARALCREGLLRELHAELETKPVTRKVLVLQRVPEGAAPPAAKEAAKGGTSRNGRIEFGSTTAAKLATALHRLMQVPVVDESGFKEAFAADLQWDASKGVEGLREALAAIGFTVTAGERQLPSYRVNRRA